MPRKDGSCLREHLLVAEEATGEHLFDDPEVPPAGEHLWSLFWELHAGRGSNGWTVETLRPADIEAWARLTGICLDPWEARALLRMDQACRAASTAKKVD